MSFQVQLTSIMEALTAAAVAEITGLLDRSCEALQQEVRRCRAENEALRRKLLTLDPVGNKTTSQHEESGPQSSLIKAHAEERPRGETQRDVVVIKTESDEEGVEVRSIKDEGHEVSVTMKMPVPSVEQWDMSPDQVPSQRSGGSTCPANVSPRIELDDTTDSGGEGSSGAVRETFGSEPVPDNTINAISSWPSPGFGLPCQYLKPASYLSDQLIDMGPGLDAVDRYCRDRRFVCRFCGKRFTSSRILETHVRVHTGERPYSCAQCGKRFTQSGHLKTHQSVHTGERPYACQHCGKRFAGKQNLRIHQQKHHRTEPGDV